MEKLSIRELGEKAAKLPLQPGVYIMHDVTGEVIYVGKAIKLKNRVSSYFHGAHNAKTEAMIAKIADFEVIMVRSEFEALVLENALIKRYSPHYNILLKDDKGYPWVRADLREEYPRFSIVSKPADDGADYFGPFSSRGAVKDAIDAVCKAFGLASCSRKFPRDIGRERPCLQYHMGACRGWCLKDASGEEYRAAFRDAVLVFEGKADAVIAELRGKMEEAAAEFRFELAAELRDRMRAVEQLKTKQHASTLRRGDMDVTGFYRGEARSCFVVLHYISGQLLDKDMELIDSPMEDDGEAISALIRQYYALRGSAPRLVLVQSGLEDAGALEEYLNELSGSKVELRVPQRGDLKVLSDTAVLNARQETERATSKEERITKTAEWLQRNLGLIGPPKRIESFDISNTGSDDIVAGMVVFVNGKPLKRDYRRFRIKSTLIQNDYASMEEAVFRRFRSYLDGDEKFSQLPDLLLIDGGEEHARAAQRQVKALDLRVPVFGMVKDDRHRTRALITPDGEEIGIAAVPWVFSFIGKIQEETHRYAIAYHHDLHAARTHASQLDGIKGVGEVRKAELLKSFKSVTAIKNASYDELCRVVPKNTALAVFEYFHSGEESQ